MRFGIGLVVVVVAILGILAGAFFGLTRQFTVEIPSVASGAHKPFTKSATVTFSSRDNLRSIHGKTSRSPWNFQRN